MIEAQEPSPPQSTPYVPNAIEPHLFEDFEGVNTTTTRPGVDDKQAYWLDGFMPLGPRRNLRTMYGVSPPVFTISGARTVSFFDFANIGATPYMIVISSDGAVFAVNMNTFAVTTIAGPGTVQASRLNTAINQWGSQFVQIVTQQTNGYFLWDGVTFYVPGGSAPGGGTMPLAIGGNAIENYQGRVWIANGATITFSAPGSLINFSSGAGGGNFTSTDSFLRVQFTQLKQTNGFLYLIADSSINYISGVQTSGSPPVTTFTNQNSDPEVGTAWPASVQVFNRNILFANPFGVQVSYGGAVTKISEALDGVYNSAGTNFGNLSPSSGKAIIFGKKVFILLLTIVDPVGGGATNKLLLWNGKLWWASQQDITLFYIQSQEINSVLTCYGTDGTTINQLFAQPSTDFQKVAQTKLWDTPGGYQLTKWINRFWGIVKYYSLLAPAVTVSLDNENGSVSSQISIILGQETWFTINGLPAQWETASAQPADWFGTATNFSVASPTAVGQQGVLTGFTVSTFAGDMAIVSMAIENDVAGYRG